MKLKPYSAADRFRLFGLTLVILFSVLTAYPAPGDVDTSFSASAYGNAVNGNVYVVEELPDGKILIAGFFTAVNGYARSGIARLNADGSVDASFTPPDIESGFGLGASIYALGLQSDGKIIIGGDFFVVNGAFSPGVKRLNPDGTLDPTFAGQFAPLVFGGVADLEVLSDDSIVIGGVFRLNATGPDLHVARLSPNGVFDGSFQNGANLDVKAIEIQPDGKILVGGSTLVRLNSDGSSDSSFAPGSISGIEDIICQSNGQVIIAGSFSSVNGFPQGRIARLDSNGSVDFNFNLNGVGANGTINDLVLKSDGKILLAGAFGTFNNQGRRRIAQLNSDGSLETTFVPSTILTGRIVNEIEQLSSGKLLVGTNFGSSATEVPPSLFRFNADGSDDGSLVTEITRSGTVYDVIQQPDGKVIYAGDYYMSNRQLRKGLTRVNPDGTLDTSFVPYFSDSMLINAFRSVALQSTGKILVGGTNGLKFIRLNQDGTEDASLPAIISGNIYDIAVQPDDKIILSGIIFVQGGGTSVTLVRLNADGTVDSSFNAATIPSGFVHKSLVQPDGKILIAGEFTQVGGSLRGHIARLNADGTLDNSFNPPGGANGNILTMDIQPDGKILVGGEFTSLNGNNGAQKIGRYNPDGTLDTSFIQTVNASVLTVKAQSDGKVLIGGSMTMVGNAARNGIARLNSNGSVDTTFNTKANRTVWAIDLQTDGRILVGGEFTKLNQTSSVAIGRLLNNQNALVRTPFDFDGDGRSDVSVLRPSTNRWYEFRSSSSSVFEASFGSQGDIPAPADYDGDGKTDIAIFRSSAGDWWYLSSLSGSQINVHFGADGDLPRPGDFDADGKDDFIVFRPSNSTWYRFGSTGAVSVITFGSAGDDPLIGDFDGDGKVDPAIYRSSTGDWWYQSSLTNAQIATHWGAGTDVPVPADYDGDGKTDLAVYRPSTGVWYILNSSTGGATIVGFGLAEDKPVAADYDGDGRADIAVFRPSTGVWYLLRTTEGFGAIEFGVSTDVPLPNAFLP
ncbi:MAG: FG-GAP-like repeat-containing protein [Pyrinomonadaceae bacterium]